MAASVAAAVAAAAIKAKLAAQGKLVGGGSALLPQQAPPPPPVGTAPPPGENPEDSSMAEIPINDISTSARTVVTRGPKQDEMGSLYGVALTTRGRYYPPGAERPDSGPDKPLHILVEAKTKEECDRAVEGINAVIEEASGGGGQGGGGGGASGGSGFGGQYSTPPVAYSQPTYSQPTNAKVYLDMYMIPGFDLRGKVTGPDGQYLGHVARETGCRVEVRGRGSGTVDPYTRLESSESMHVFVEHTDPQQVAAAKELCQSLVSTVRAEWNEFKSKPPPPQQQQQQQHHHQQQQHYGAPPHHVPYGVQARPGPGYAPYHPPAGYPQQPGGAYGQMPYGAPPVPQQQHYPGQQGQWGYAAQSYPGPPSGMVPPAGASPGNTMYNAAPPVMVPQTHGGAAVAPGEAPPLPPGEAPPLPPGAPPPAAPAASVAAPYAGQPPIPQGPLPPSHEVAAAPKRKFTEAVAPPKPQHPSAAHHVYPTSDDHSAKKPRSGPLVDYS